MAQFLLSPTTLRYLPVLLLHLVSLGYLLLRGPRSRQSWLFCGWLAGMTAMTASQCAAWSLYGSRISTYLEWWGGVLGVSLAIVALLQFAYAFPRPRYKREARGVLYLSVLITAGLGALVGVEALAARGARIYATSPAAAGAAFAPQANWFIYNFERFSFGAVAQRSARVFISFRLFDLWQIVGHLWILGVWLRKTLRFSTGAGGARRMWEARASRAWLLMMCLFPLPVIASILDGANVLPPGTFAAAHLLVLFGIMLTYVNFSPEPTTFMTKLVGMSLVTLLALLGFVSGTAMRAQREAYTKLRRAELRHLAALLDVGRFDSLPPDILYVAARRVPGLFAPDYRMIAARPGAPEASALAAHDALLREGLARRHYPARCAVLHENPWLGLQGVAALEGMPAEIDETLEIPPGVMAYRGSASEPQARVVRFSFTHAGTRYEVGYRYLDYRRFLHRGARSLAALMVAATAGVLLAFPHFFRVSLVAPLMGLLAGLNRVNRGERHVHVPVRAEDEIGEMTHAFNRMVGSLRASEAQLNALNLTLEQRVVDRTRDLVTLYEMSAMINRAESLPALFEGVLERVVPAVDGFAGVILLAEEDGGRLTLAASCGPALEWGDALQGSPLWRKVCERRDALLIHDLVADGVLALGVADPRCATLVGVPIPGQTGCLGVLAIFGHTAYLFNVEDLGLLGAVAEQLGVAVENTRLRRRAAEALVVEERQRLARDLHDSVTQLLYSQTLFAEGAALSLQQGHWERAAHCVTRLGETTRRALREMRLMIYRLRPAELAELGLVGVLQRRLERVEQRAGIRASLISEGVGGLSPVQEEALYYCAEEALNNALKHANASDVRVELRRADRSLLLSVRDDGCGFDPDRASSGFGLQNLRERTAGLGGTFVVQSSPGAGTRITVCLPEDAEEPSPPEELRYEQTHSDSDR